MRYVVGYTADERGRNAIDLAVAFARGQDATLTLVLVLPPAEPFQAVYPPESDYSTILIEQAEAWLTEAVAMVPAGITVTAEIRFSHSLAEGLMAAASDLHAALIIIGTGKGGLFNRSTVGKVAQSLLHASMVPVAIAPQGYTASREISRITFAVGNRGGGQAIRDVGITSANQRGIPLRVISLLALDTDDPVVRERAWAQANEARESALERLPAGSTVTAEIAQGETIEEAVTKIEWNNEEVVIVGSSRLAERNKLFLGSTANKMMRSLPVPMVVVPRDYVVSDDPGLSVADDTAENTRDPKESGN
ncbi:universal stress protein [Lysinibacter sp. HNR]|uniref:universal stress protein n=1 Tax=Lysinibacter sp. HNR TaxID=3031408 RepID=UPI002434CAB4|nr:universal stress protein [Lysinibacter sp. HNR]WGD38350.1 universal stress protein [Lysinibacter sp. HNR]